MDYSWDWNDDFLLANITDLYFEGVCILCTWADVHNVVKQFTAFHATLQADHISSQARAPPEAALHTGDLAPHMHHLHWAAQGHLAATATVDRVVL
jgi:hypothetical protein